MAESSRAAIGDEKSVMCGAEGGNSGHSVVTRVMRERETEHETKRAAWAAVEKLWFAAGRRQKLQDVMAIELPPNDLAPTQAVTQRRTPQGAADCSPLAREIPQAA